MMPGEDKIRTTISAIFVWFGHERNPLVPCIHFIYIAGTSSSQGDPSIS
jgi:hypothetical protein